MEDGATWLVLRVRLLRLLRLLLPTASASVSLSLSVFLARVLSLSLSLLAPAPQCVDPPPTHRHPRRRRRAPVGRAPCQIGVFYLEFRVDRAIFFNFDSGLSIGFGAEGLDCSVPADRTAGCQLLLAGNSIVGTIVLSFAVGMYAAMVAVRKAALVKEVTSKAIDATENRELEQEFALKLGEHATKKKERRRSKRLLSDSDQEAFARLEQLHSRSSSPEQGPGVGETIAGLLTLRRGTLARVMSSPLTKMCVVFLVWLLFGVVFGLAHEGWDFTTSLLFAVGVMTTAGFQAPSTGVFSMLFVVASIRVSQPPFPSEAMAGA